MRWWQKQHFDWSALNETEDRKVKQFHSWNEEISKTNGASKGVRKPTKPVNKRFPRLDEASFSFSSSHLWKFHGKLSSELPFGYDTRPVIVSCNENIWLVSVLQQPLACPDAVLERLDAVLPSVDASMIPEGHLVHLFWTNRIPWVGRKGLGDGDCSKIERAESSNPGKAVLRFCTRAV